MNEYGDDEEKMRKT